MPNVPGANQPLAPGDPRPIIGTVPITPQLGLAALAGLPATAPAYDPQAPEESELQLQNWLKPQIDIGAAQAINARGILPTTGVGQLMTQAAEQGLTGGLPQVSPAQAAYDDFSKFYGQDVARSVLANQPELFPGVNGGPNMPAPAPKDPWNLSYPQNVYDYWNVGLNPGLDSTAATVGHWVNPGDPQPALQSGYKLPMNASAPSGVWYNLLNQMFAPEQIPQGAVHYNLAPPPQNAGGAGPAPAPLPATPAWGTNPPPPPLPYGWAPPPTPGGNVYRAI